MTGQSNSPVASPIISFTYASVVSAITSPAAAQLEAVARRKGWKVVEPTACFDAVRLRNSLANGSTTVNQTDVTAQ